MPSDTNSEIDCEGVIEEPGTMTCVKAKKGEVKRDWSAEAQAAADMLRPLTAAEQRDMVDRLRMALGVEHGVYIGGEKPIPQWTNQQTAAAAAAAAAVPEPEKK